MHKIHFNTFSSSNKKLTVFPRILPKSRLFVANLSAALFLELLIAPGFSTPKQEQSKQSFLDANRDRSWEVAQTYRPPNRGAPASTEGAGTRGGSCIASGEKKLTALTPLIPGRDLGLTVSPYPTFFAYIPQSSAKTGEFILRDRNNRLIYKTSFPLPSQPGIVSISLPNTQRPLEVNKSYQWSFLLVCDPNDRSGNTISNTAWIERIPLNQTLANQIKNTTPNNLPALYANAGIWHEALASSAQLRHSQPDSVRLAANWRELLRSARLQDFMQAPLVNCCQVSSR